MANGNWPPRPPAARNRTPRKPDSSIVGGWRAAAAFVFALLTLAVFVWLMFEVVVRDNVGAYCKVRDFFLPLCLLSFTILGVFVGGWAEASWRPSGHSLFSRLATRAGGGVAFFLIAAAVLYGFRTQDNCPQALTYSFAFEKPAEVTIEPDWLNNQWYQHHPQQVDAAHGKLFYMTGPDAMDRDPFDDLTFRLNLGGGGSSLCPINVRIYHLRSSFKSDCSYSADANAFSFKLSADLVAYASSLATQANNQAPIEAANSGAKEPEEKECFAEIRASDTSIKAPFNEKFMNDGRPVRLSGRVTIYLYKGAVCIKDGSGKPIFPVRAANASSRAFSWFRPLTHLISPAYAQEDCADNEPLESTPFDQLLEGLASDEPGDATASLVANFRIYECKIYDVVLGSETGASVAARLLRVIALAPVGWSNNRLIANDAFPDLRPNEKAKRVFDLAIEKFIISDNDELRFQARKLLTTYPAKYVRDRYATVDIDRLGELQRMYFSYAGIFIYSGR